MSEPETLRRILETCRTIAIKARVLWMQLGVINVEAGSLAAAAGLEVIMDRCAKIDHARLLGAAR